MRANRAVYLVAGVFVVTLIVSAYKLILAQREPQTMSMFSNQTMGRLASLSGEGFKRPLQSKIWSPLKAGDDIYVGEVLETKNSSQGTLDFGSGLLIYLDSNSSLRPWVGKNGERNFDYISGHVFINSSGTNKDFVWVVSRLFKIKINQAQFFIQDHPGSSRVSIVVFSGQVEASSLGTQVKIDGGKVGEVSGSGIQIGYEPLRIKGPKHFEEVHIDKENSKPILFEWEALKQQREIFLEIGERRENLVKMFPGVSATEGLLAMKLSPGFYYWRLVSQTNLETAVRILNIKLEQPPIPLWPAIGELVAGNAITGEMKVKWANPGGLERLQIEVSKDKDFTKNIYSEEVLDTGAHEFPLETDGRYYWRISGFKPRSSGELVSEVRYFDFKNNWSLVPPRIMEPEHGAVKLLSELKSEGLFLRWKELPGKNKYEVTVIGPRNEYVLHQIVEGKNQIKVKVESPGIYKFYVLAIDQNGSRSRPGAVSVQVR